MSLARLKNIYYKLRLRLDILRGNLFASDSTNFIDNYVDKNVPLGVEHLELAIPKSQVCDFPTINSKTGRKFQISSVDELELLKNVKTSCTDPEKIGQAIQLRLRNNLPLRLPEDRNDSSYYVRNGLKHVYPYHLIHQCYTKSRWLGVKLRKIMKTEFHELSNAQLKSRFNMKQVLVNGMPVDYDYVLKNGDFITNSQHIHEPPVLATPIKILHMDKETIVIDKPPSLPVHYCGPYRHNTVLWNLREEHGIEGLKVVHRLDRLVSGILMFALSSERVKYLQGTLKSRTVEKEYVCRVAGEFPLGDPTDDGFVTVEQPLAKVPGRIGLVAVFAGGKPSLSKFKRLNYNGITSAVLCRPLTGRMHQIRVHLQYLGYPIVNDYLYNCESFGPNRGRGGVSDMKVRKLSSDVLKEIRAKARGHIEGSGFDQSGKQSEVFTRNFADESERHEVMSALFHYFTEDSRSNQTENWSFDPKKLMKDDTCHECQEKCIDPPLKSLFLYLHALRYSSPEWCYETDLPIWAEESWRY